MLTIDFSNVFNLVDRTVLHRQSARLYVGDGHIRSTIGVHQEDPLGPIIFALVLHLLVPQNRNCCKLHFHAWYLDDGSITGYAREVAKALDIIRTDGPCLGLKLIV